MPESFGKRQRRDANAKKAAAREARRVARAQRRKDREAGLIEPGPPIGPPEQSEWLVGTPPDETGSEEPDTEESAG